jgi:hypothetical protein
MNKKRDLLPWILGGLSAAAIAVAFATVSTHRTAPSSPSQVSAVQPPAPTQMTALPVPTTAPTPSPAAPSPALVSPAAEPDSIPSPPPPSQVQNGQIWECVTHGIKTFSNNPCGENSTQLDVGPINTMSVPAAIHYARAYGPEPRYATGYPDQSAPANADDYGDQNAAETGGNSYTIVQGVRFVARRHPEHIIRPLPPHHNPMPVRR